MPDERRYYVHSDDNCKFESMTKEQILAAIVQAVEGHSISDVDTGFVQVLKEQNHGAGLKFWIGSTAEYNALQSIDQDCFYILTDDTELDDMEADIESFRASLVNMGVAVSTLSDTVAGHTSSINSINTKLSTLDEDKWVRDAKKSLMLLEQEVDYGDDLDILLHSNSDRTHPTPSLYLSEFKMVEVFAYASSVLCTVATSFNAGETNLLFIRGTVPYHPTCYHPEVGGDPTGELAYINIEIVVDAASNTIIQQHSTMNSFVLLNLNDNVVTRMYPLKIYAIRGVM